MATNEWYTPPECVIAIKQVLGEIDLDPASCEFANQIIQAKQYFTREDNALTHQWYGRVFLNPPYGKTQLGQASNLEYFTRYLLDQYESGNVTEAILLIPVNTATRWFDALWKYPICFPKFRIRFYQETGEPSNGVSFGTCFVYLGENEQLFANVFSRFGHVVRAITPSKPRITTLDLWTPETASESAEEVLAS